MRFAIAKAKRTSLSRAYIVKTLNRSSTCLLWNSSDLPELIRRFPAIALCCLVTTGPLKYFASSGEIYLNDRLIAKLDL